MKNGIVISDTGPIFSLAIINQLELLVAFFEEIYIPKAVWEELTLDETTSEYPIITTFFKEKIKEIKSPNNLKLLMDLGESESVILYQEIDANFLLIDDRKARRFAENLGVNCIGTLGILSKAREKGLIQELKSLFETLLQNKRYYGIPLLNMILRKHGEEEFSH